MIRLSRILVGGLLATGLAVTLPATAFELDSADVTAGGRLGEAHVFEGFGCSGGNLSPQLAWRNAPEGTRSYAITAYDPDAPTGSGWWHWVVWNIPASTDNLPRGIGKLAKLPDGAVEGRTDFGEPGYGGACPPPGDEAHRYIFTVHALKVERLDLPANPTAALVGYMVNANTLGKASLTGHYAR